MIWYSIVGVHTTLVLVEIRDALTTTNERSHHTRRSTIMAMTMHARAHTYLLLGSRVTATVSPWMDLFIPSLPETSTFSAKKKRGEQRCRLTDYLSKKKHAGGT